MRISDWSSDVCSSDLPAARNGRRLAVLQDDARQYGDGARQDRSRHRPPLCRAGGGPGAVRRHLRDDQRRLALTRDSLLDATGQSRLLAHSPALDASIRLRLPYIEPLNLLQVDLIRRLRGGDSDEKVVTGIQLTINAIATALKNSG